MVNLILQLTNSRETRTIIFLSLNFKDIYYVATVTQFKLELLLAIYILSVIMTRLMNLVSL